ncbi:MAG: magnesium transporter [Anaerolineae bacterium]
MEETRVDAALRAVRALLEANDIQAAIRVLESLNAPDQADVFEELSPEHQETLLPRMDTEDSADILEELPDEDAAELAQKLPVDALADIVDEMEPDEAADLLGDLPDATTAAVLNKMEDAQEVLPLLAHEDDTAGGLMAPPEVVLHERMTAEQAICHVRKVAPDSETVYYLFVVDDENHLVGVVSLRELIVADPQARIRDIMNRDVISVRVDADQEEAARLMTRYDLLGLPVVDHENHLLGIIAYDEVADILEEEATEDIQRFGGAQPLDKPYLSTAVSWVARKRLGWLLLLFITETFTGSVLRHFESTLSQVVSLAFFVPLLIGTGGNSGSQTTSTIIRALAIGDVDTKDIFRVYWHESRVGLVLGAMMAAVAFIRALTWGTTVWVAIAVAASIWAIVLWANSLGALLPIIAHKLHIDPTVVSGPVMSTLVDATGLFIYFTIARTILRL